MSQRNVYIIIAIVVAVVGGFFLLRNDNQRSGRFDSFAQCLAEKGVTMYGATWCPHCQNEKNAFGTSFRFIPYVECPDDPKRCLAAGVAGYPTWIFSDGKKLEGEQGIEQLSRESGCALP